MTEQHVNEFGQPVGRPLPHWQSPVFPPRIALAGQYCRIDPLDADRHAQQLFDSFALDTSGAMWTYLPVGPFSTIFDLRSWTETVTVREDPQFYAIVDQATDAAIGVASYMRIDPSNGCIEVGHLAFSPLLQRTTAATEAMFLMMKQAFLLGYRRYEWKCDALNHPSRLAAQRLGFTFEGVFRQAVVTRLRNRDTAWYSVIDLEWPALQKAFEEWLSADNFDATGRQHRHLTELTATVRGASSLHYGNGKGEG